MISFSELTQRLFALQAKDFEKTGLEVARDGTVYAKTVNNNNKPLVKQSEDGITTKIGRAIAKKVKENDPDLYDAMTETEDMDCDLRKSRKNNKVWGVFADGEEDPSDVYKI
jgi:hypothetical protein